MPTEIVMPRLSDTMDSGTIAKWHKHEGDAVKRGEVIAEIETDKANMELESYANGILARVMVAEGQSAALGQPIALVAADEAEAQSLQGTPALAASTPAAPPAPGYSQDEPAPQAAFGTDGSSDVPTTPTPAPSEPVMASSRPGDSAPAASNGAGTDRAPSDGRIKASPLARRIAQEHGIELTQVVGTGPSGRITKEDVQLFVKQQAQPQAPVPAVSSGPSAAPRAPEAPPQPDSAAEIRGTQAVEMTRMQQTIARRMTAARFSAPDFVLTAEFDMTEARALLRSIASSDGAPRVGPNDLLVKAVASALREHPEVNGGWENDGIVRYSHINVGVAVAIEGGLVVPVIRDADTRSLGALAQESKGLIERARSGKLAPADYEGGTFSISNLGMYGIDQFTPVINTPEACILGVGAIVQKPVVADGEIVVRDRMRVTLSCDHRVVNGAEGAAFLQTLRRKLENPMLTLV